MILSFRRHWTTVRLAGEVAKLTSEVDLTPCGDVRGSKVNLHWLLTHALNCMSYKNAEMLLDVRFCAEEVAAAVKKLKLGKAAGPDGLLAEHLK